jgi:hypothetical protein
MRKIRKLCESEEGAERIIRVTVRSWHMINTHLPRIIEVQKRARDPPPPPLPAADVPLAE